ncbi:MAG: hypothetical protein M1330_00415 [Armatimonadetes bacterium]|nr:hypothetical protein [Armatimonadota bacterium]
MKKLIKVALAVLVPLLIIGGAVYGLAKMKVIPIQKLATKNKTMARILTAIKLYQPSAPKKPAKQSQPVTSASVAAVALAPATHISPNSSPLSTPPSLPVARPKPSTQINPKRIYQLSNIYDTMDPSDASKILIKLPDSELIPLFRQMDERKVGQILVAFGPTRAAKLTKALLY